MEILLGGYYYGTRSHLLRYITSQESLSQTRIQYRSRPISLNINIVDSTMATPMILVEESLTTSSKNYPSSLFSISENCVKYETLYVFFHINLLFPRLIYNVCNKIVAKTSLVVVVSRNDSRRSSI